MKNFKFHNTVKQLSGYNYNNKKFKMPKGWIEYDKYSNPKNGFHAKSFINGDYLVINFKGTDMRKPGGRMPSGKDFWEDILMGIYRTEPTQIVDARIYYEKLKKKFPNKIIILSGHSLGGSLAQILATETGEQAVTFSAYGTANLTKTKDKYLNNITNYGNIDDPVFRSNITNQVGETYIIYNTDKINMDNMHIDRHFIENMGDISKAVLISQDTMVNPPKLKSLKGLFDRELKYDEYNPNNVILQEDIKSMPKQKLKDKVDYYMHQAFKGLVMTAEEAKKKFLKGELIWVNEYVRADGTKVRGYYRAKPRQ